MAIRKKKHKRGSGNTQEVQNAAKTLYANIRFQSVDNPIKSILITSTVPNEGKTATAALLAQAIGSAGMRVLLVECDMRRRSMAAELDAHATHGLYSVLSGEVALKDAVVPTNYPLVQFLDAEPGIPNPAELLSSKRMAKLSSLIEASYDYVLYDTPPVGTFVDAAILSTLVDGVIIAVRPDTAKRTDIVSAYEQLQAANANILGLCGTFAEGTGSEYYYAYYTKDGKRVRRSERSSNADAMMPLMDSSFQPANLGDKDQFASEMADQGQEGTAQSNQQRAAAAVQQQRRQAAAGAQRAVRAGAAVQAGAAAQQQVRQAASQGGATQGEAVLPGRGRRK